MPAAPSGKNDHSDRGPTSHRLEEDRLIVRHTCLGTNWKGSMKRNGPETSSRGGDPHEEQDGEVAAGAAPGSEGLVADDKAHGRPLPGGTTASGHVFQGPD